MIRKELSNSSFVGCQIGTLSNLRHLPPRGVVRSPRGRDAHNHNKRPSRRPSRIETLDGHVRQSAALTCRDFINRYATPIDNAFQCILVFGGRVHLTFVGNQGLLVDGLAHNVLNVVASARRLNVVGEFPLNESN